MCDSYGGLLHRSFQQASQTSTSTGSPLEVPPVGFASGRMHVLHVDGRPQHVVSAAHVLLPTCTGDKDSGFFRAKLVADYSVAPNREDKLNVEVLAPCAHACICMIKSQTDLSFLTRTTCQVAADGRWHQFEWLCACSSLIPPSCLVRSSSLRNFPRGEGAGGDSHTLTTTIASCEKLIEPCRPCDVSNQVLPDASHSLDPTCWCPAQVCQHRECIRAGEMMFQRER